MVKSTGINKRDKILSSIKCNQDLVIGDVHETLMRYRRKILGVVMNEFLVNTSYHRSGFFANDYPYVGFVDSNPSSEMDVITFNISLYRD